MDLKEIKVLVIDDEKMVSRMLKGFLEDKGFSAITAYSGEEGLGILRRETYDAVIVDMRLPDIDGNTFIVKAHTICPEATYLIHTGSVDYQLTEDLVNIGIDDEFILYKPVLDMNTISDLILKKIKKR